MIGAAAQRKRDLAAYPDRRAAFLKAHPRCQVCGRRKSRDVHHSFGRLGKLLLNQELWLAVCRVCHDWVHQHPGQARIMGWLAAKGRWNETVLPR
jgi:hypothetical protein